MPVFDNPRAREVADSTFAQLVSDARLNFWYGDPGERGMYLTVFDHAGKRHMAYKVGTTTEGYTRSFAEGAWLAENPGRQTARVFRGKENVAAVRGIDFIYSVSGLDAHACEYFLVTYAVNMTDLTRAGGRQILEGDAEILNGSGNEVALFLAKLAVPPILLD